MVCTQVHCCQISRLSHHFPCRVPPLTKIEMLHSLSVIPNAVRDLPKGKVGAYASPMLIDRPAPGTTSEILSVLG